jgi:tRNA nucleotidyltransferase/poly(A) polymerase
MKMYMVGGAVRDEILGVPSKDIDFVVVLNTNIVNEFEDPFVTMVASLTEMGFKIFLSTPEYLTVRAQFPSGDGDFNTFLTGGPVKTGSKRLTADFVLARKEGEYTDGRRPDKVVPGTLMDDLRRRDFTMNAIAKNESGEFIDPFNGRLAIANRTIAAVDDPVERLEEDALRAVRAIRFAVTKGFQIEKNLRHALEFKPVLDSLRENISDERIKDELSKMFRFDTARSLRVLEMFPLLREAIFTGKVSLDATLKQRGRG